MFYNKYTEKLKKLEGIIENIKDCPDFKMITNDEIPKEFFNHNGKNLSAGLIKIYYFIDKDNQYLSFDKFWNEVSNNYETFKNTDIIEGVSIKTFGYYG